MSLRKYFEKELPAALTGRQLMEKHNLVSGLCKAAEKWLCSKDAAVSRDELLKGLK